MAVRYTYRSDHLTGLSVCGSLIYIQVRSVYWTGCLWQINIHTWSGTGQISRLDGVFVEALYTCRSDQLTGLGVCGSFLYIQVRSVDYLSVCGSFIYKQVGSIDLLECLLQLYIHTGQIS